MPGLAVYRGTRSFGNSLRIPKLQEPVSCHTVHVRGRPVTIVDSVRSAQMMSKLLMQLSPEAVTAWKIEPCDLDTKRFHTAGHLGGRILCAACTVKGVDFGGGSQSLFIDAYPQGEQSECDESSAVSPILSEFQAFFEDDSKLKCSHSIVEDFHVLKHHGITLRGIESDTRYLARLANTALSSWEGTADDSRESGYDLRTLSNTYRSAGQEFFDPKIDRFLRKFNGAKIAHYSAAMRPYWISRTVENAFLTLELRERLREELEASPWITEVLDNPDRSMWDLANTIHRPLITILAELEAEGIGVDVGLLTSIRSTTRSRLGEHLKGFRDACGSMKDPLDPSSYLNCDADMINPASPPQIRQLLFGCPTTKQSELFCFSEKGTKRCFPRQEVFSAPFDGSQVPISIHGIGLRPILSRMNKKRLSDFSSRGLPSVNRKVLVEYSGTDPINGIFGKAIEKDQLGRFGTEYARHGAIMLYHLAKLGKYEYVLSSFIDPLLDRVHGDGYRIHPSLSLDTSTGRLVCRKPNLHNPPNAADILGLRSVFRASRGNVLIVADYSQLELRILAHVTNCKSMISSLAAGGDYHSWTAVDMFDHVRSAVNTGRCSVIPVPQIPTVKQMFPSERSKAKVVNFSIAYGKCARSIAEDIDCPLHEAEELLSNWYSGKPEVAGWKVDTVFRARISKKVTSILGRTRDIPLIDNKLWKSRSERAAVNHCIQGSAADIAICAMIRIGMNGELRRLGFKLLMQIHDEFIIEGPESHAHQAKAILVDIMQNPFQTLSQSYALHVPLDVDVGVGKTWAEAKP
jgi:DNA polymerase-1